MSCFELTNKMFESLNTLMTKFWCGQVSENRRLHWLSQARLSLPKDSGVWVSEISPLSIGLCLQNSVGASSQTKTFYCLMF
ncbi:hypothetical protein LINPERHAP1_LOCUS20142 [Linum perenne]